MFLLSREGTDATLCRRILVGGIAETSERVWRTMPVPALVEKIWFGRRMNGKRASRLAARVFAGSLEKAV